MPLRLRKPKKEGKVEEKPKKKEEKTLLEKLCEHYGVPYSILYTALPLPSDPRGKNIEEFEKEGIQHKKHGDDLRARSAYWGAAGAALFIGDVSLAKNYFMKCVELSEPKFSYRKNFEYLTEEKNIKKVIRIVKDYYEKTLKPEEEKKD